VKFRIGIRDESDAGTYERKRAPVGDQKRRADVHEDRRRATAHVRDTRGLASHREANKLGSARVCRGLIDEHLVHSWRPLGSAATSTHARPVEGHRPDASPARCTRHRVERNEAQAQGRRGIHIHDPFRRARPRDARC